MSFPSPLLEQRPSDSERSRESHPLTFCLFLGQNPEAFLQNKKVNTAVQKIPTPSQMTATAAELVMAITTKRKSQCLLTSFLYGLYLGPCLEKAFIDSTFLLKKDIFVTHFL